MNNILLCEDEVELSAALSAILEHNDYIVDNAYDGVEALNCIESNNYDLIILDVMMPKMDGITVLKKVRESGNNVPILMLTAKSELDDKVVGLDSGADDYLTKPFATKELLARLRVLTRRQIEANHTVLKINNLELDRETYEMRTENGSFRLANKEFQMLEMLMLNKEHIILSDRFFEKIWGNDKEVENNVVWVYISYLRKKIQALSANVEINVLENGYLLKVL